MRLTVEEIAGAVGGRVELAAFDRGDAAGAGAATGAAAPSATAPTASGLVTGMTWDSRDVKPGDMYVCLPGERVDGHDFADAAAVAGAAAVLASHTLDTLSNNVPVIVVENTQQAIADLATYWRGRLKGTVVGLTGSTGKTTTKGLVRDVLQAAGSVVATKANQNNELGVPATLLAADEDTDFVVVEMGMRGLGQIEELCQIAKPDWGLVTNVGESHIELLGSRENIARAKAELFAGLSESGIAFANEANDYVGELCRFGGCEERGVKVVFFEGGDAWPHTDDLGVFDSSNPHPFVYASDIALDAEGRPTFTMHAVQFEGAALPGANGECTCALELRGLHNVSNACSAAAVGLACGLTLAQCCEALAQSQPEQGRQRVLHTAADITVVDDAYNANPDSMAASLATFAALDVAGRHIAVLGDMGELGAFAPECHDRVGAIAAHSSLDILICVGTLAERIALAAGDAGMDPSSVRHVSTVEAALGELEALLEPGDAVLVKASHFMEFDRIVEGLVG